MKMDFAIVHSKLKEVGVCNRCCLRLMGQKLANFEDPESYLQELSLENSQEGSKMKKTRNNPCSVCLGSLEETFLDKILINLCWNNLQEYDCTTYRVNLDMPPNSLIREKAVNLFLKQSFPEFYDEKKLNQNVLPISAAFRYAFKAKLDEKCGKKYDIHSGTQLWIHLSHEDNEKEIQVMNNLDFNTYSRRIRLGNKMYGKNAVSNTLAETDDKKITKYLRIPPEIPTTPVEIESVTFESEPAFIGGRYCKYSRTLSQTPWRFGDKDEENPGDARITACVQDLIFDGLHEVFGFEKDRLTFSASGREDTDVRCLGSGRPFYIKIDNAKKKYSKEYYRELEQKINQSPDISIFDVQPVDRESLKEVKQGEEMKKKGYIALCVVRGIKNIDKIIEKINELGSTCLVVGQNTPVRVAHRRTLSLRKKRIYYMEATKINGHDNLVELTVITEAGTYVKEFIHGDFERTSPSLGDLIEADIDIYLLDVIGIDLDWPIRINSKPHPAMKHIKNNCIGLKNNIDPPGVEEIEKEEK